MYGLSRRSMLSGTTFILGRNARGCVFFAVFFAADFFMAARFCAALLVAINPSSEKVRQRGRVVLLSAPRYRSWSEQKRKAARASSPRRLVLLFQPLTTSFR